MKNLQFFENVKGNFAIFLKFCRIFGENLDKNLETLKICIYIRCGERTPPTLANLKKSEQKNQWKSAVFDNFNGNFDCFQIFSNFIEVSRKSRQNLEKFRNEHSYAVLAILLKSMWKISGILECSNGNFAIF